MSVETHRVLLGTCGWKHQAWNNDFYSEDLPEEWQLGFYSNEFPVVYVPASDWIDVAESDMHQLEEWTEDVSETFRFILEVPEHVLKDEALFATAINKAKLLGDFCLGLVLQVSPDFSADTQFLQNQLKLAMAVAPVCIDSGGEALSSDIEQFLKDQKIKYVWNGEEENTQGSVSASLSFSRVSGENLDMAGLRRIVEICLADSNEHCTSVLCLDGEPPSLEQLRNADTILNLL